MPAIPKNNLRERMLKLGYKAELMKVVPPVLDNSRVVKDEPKPVFQASTYQAPPQTAPTTSTTYPSNISDGGGGSGGGGGGGTTFKLENINIDEWSDFDEDE
jgi:hypothetical protein